jgi:hypothetical protein
LVGQLHSLEIPNLNKVYEDNYCTVYIHDVYGNQDLLVIHTDVIATKKREILEHYFEVIESVFDALRERGVKEVEACVSEDHEIRFAQFYGFDQFIGQLTVHGRETVPAVFRLKKEL